MENRSSLQRKYDWVGIGITVVLTLLLMGFTLSFGLLENWKTNFFSVSSEDLVKDVYTTTYHVAYDSSALQCYAMNYPYGEYHTYTGLQDWVAMPLQLLKRAGVPHPERAALPLINFLVLCSILLCSLSLYLVLRELTLPPWFSVLGALFITFLSPQLQRIGGHLSLSYACALPLMIYFFMRHLKSQRWVWSLLFGLLAFALAFAHPYYLMFFIALSLVSHGYLALCRRQQWGWKRIFFSFALQCIIPTLLFLWISHWDDTVIDRTSVPFGFYKYRGRIEGLLFPYGRPYFMDDSILFAPVEWETRNYLGIIAVVTMLVIVWNFFKNLFTKHYRLLLRPTDNPSLNLLFFAAFLLMIFSCGVPLTWFPHRILNYLGPLAQLRAMGRLLWLFFYVGNILTLYCLYQWWQHPNRKPFRTYLFIFALLLYGGECCAYNWNTRFYYQHSWDEWTDYKNTTHNNLWLKQLNTNDYQAILSLPVFNTGSESFYIPSQGGIFQKSAYISIKTGLPLICNEDARSSIHQSWNCIALSRLAWQNFALLDHLPDQRPLLTVTNSDRTTLNSDEQKLLHYAQPLFSIEGADFYRLPIDSIKAMVRHTQDSLRHAYTAATRYTVGRNIACSDTTQRPLFISMLKVNRTKSLKYSNTGIINRETVVYDGPLKLQGAVEISFWMTHILDDMYSRSKLTITAYNGTGAETQLYCWDANALLNIVDNNNGMLRLTDTLPPHCQRLRITLRNPEMRSLPISFYHLLVRPTNCHTATATPKGHYINNIPVKL